MSELDKLKAENKKLLDDIRVVALGEPFEAIQMRMKWRRKFKVIDLKKRK